MIDIEGMLAACEDNIHRLTKWEADFIESLREQFDRTHTLSDRQVEILDRIYLEKTP